jgi:DNA-binding GntR family transcriptional regulator
MEREDQDAFWGWHAVRTKRDLAYEYIKSEILAGRLLPGQRIVLNQIATELGMSAVPVREALFQLSNEHLVAFTPHVGAMVAIANIDSLVSIIEPLAVLEGYATRLARSSGSLEAVLNELRLRNDVMRRHVAEEDWQGVSRSNKAFHFVLYEASGNDVLLASIRGLWERIEAHLGLWSFHLIPQRAASSVGDHDTIVRMLADPATEDLEIELFAREHKLETGRRFAKHGHQPQEKAPRAVAGGR